MPKDPHLAAYEREFDPDEDYSWMDRYSRPDDEALSGKAWVAVVCAGLALSIVLAGVA